MCEEFDPQYVGQEVEVVRPRVGVPPLTFDCRHFLDDDILFR